MGGPFDLKPLHAWATPFYQRLWADHPAEAPGIVAHLYDLKARTTARIASGVAPAAKSAAGLFESEFDVFADPHWGSPDSSSSPRSRCGRRWPTSTARGSGRTG